MLAVDAMSTLQPPRAIIVNHMEQRAGRPAVKVTGLAAGLVAVPDSSCRCAWKSARASGLGMSWLAVTGTPANCCIHSSDIGFVIGVANRFRITKMSCGSIASGLRTNKTCLPITPSTSVAGQHEKSQRDALGRPHRQKHNSYLRHCVQTHRPG